MTFLNYFNPSFEQIQIRESRRLAAAQKKYDDFDEQARLLLEPLVKETADVLGVDLALGPISCGKADFRKNGSLSFPSASVTLHRPDIVSKNAGHKEGEQRGRFFCCPSLFDPDFSPFFGISVSFQEYSESLRRYFPSTRGYGSKIYDAKGRNQITRRHRQALALGQLAFLAQP